MYSKISIIGMGFVGGAMEKSFNILGISVICYDKYKNIGKFEDCLVSDIMFLCLPTLYDNKIEEFNKDELYQVFDKLYKYNYNGLVVIKSTIEPESTNNFCKLYPSLKFVHNPEFLSAATAYYDFHNQSHIVLGLSNNVTTKTIEPLEQFYIKNYPNAKISICSSVESETMKIFANSFYAVKIQFFNELYLTCKNNNSDFNKVKEMMLSNKWINPMHTSVPGTDGKLSYGGVCFPKDTFALYKYLCKKNIPHKVLKATIDERNEMRED